MEETRFPSRALVHEDLVTVRDLVLQDDVALLQWKSVTDSLVHRAVGRVRTKQLVDQGNYADAVLLSLQYWQPEEVDIIQVLRKHHLNALADTIKLSFGSGTPAKLINNSNVWFGVDELPCNFTGREQELAKLHEMITKNGLSRSSGSKNTYSIVGLGGIGKSTLARRYAHSFRESYDGNVVWIPADSLNSISTTFSQLASIMSIQIASGASDEQLSSKVYAGFANYGKKCLFIFDNVEEREHLQIYQPRIKNPEHSSPVLLVTSRTIDLIHLAKNQLKLGVLSDVDAKELIQTVLGEVDHSSTKRLADTLQNLPLALQQAVAYIKDCYQDDPDGIAKYIEQFDISQNELKLLKDKRFQNFNSYEHTVHTVWNITIKKIIKLCEMDGSVIRFINTLAFLNPNEISELFLREVFEGKAQDNLNIMVKFSMLSRTREYGNPKSGGVAIHRLVQKVIRVRLDPNQRSTVVNFLVHLVQQLLVRDNSAHLWMEAVSHALNLFQFQRISKTTIREESEYFAELCHHLTSAGKTANALLIAQECARVYDRIWGHSDHCTILMKYRLCGAYERMSNLEKCVAIVTTLLPTAVSSLGNHHPLSLLILKKVADILSHLWLHQEAIEVYDLVVSFLRDLQRRIDSAHRGSIDRFIWRCQHGKGLALLKDAKVDEANILLGQCHDAAVELLGENHAYTLVARRDLARAMCMDGNAEEGLVILKRIRDVAVMKFGVEYQFTLDVQYWIQVTQTTLMSAMLREYFPIPQDSAHSFQDLRPKMLKLMEPYLRRNQCHYVQPKGVTINWSLFE